MIIYGTLKMTSEMVSFCTILLKSARKIETSKQIYSLLSSVLFNAYQSWQSRPYHQKGQRYYTFCSVNERSYQEELWLAIFHRHLSHLMTKPTKWLCVQRELISAWASAHSDQSSLSAWRKLGSLKLSSCGQRRLIRNSYPLSVQRRLRSN